MGIGVERNMAFRRDRRFNLGNVTLGVASKNILAAAEWRLLPIQALKRGKCGIHRFVPRHAFWMAWRRDVV